jgi:DNA-binding response OmpR family regulator
VKVLVIDDNLILLKVLTTYLKGLGHTVIYTPDFKDAYSLALLEHPDVIVIDYFLPGGTGIELISLLEKRVEFDSVKYILMSGSTINFEQILGNDLLHGYLQKPFALAELQDMIA